MVLYFSNNFSSSTHKDIFFSLKGLTYLLILGNIKANGLITSFKYAIKYLEVFFVSINFEITVLLTPTSQIYIYFFLHNKIPLLDAFVLLVLLPLFSN